MNGHEARVWESLSLYESTDLVRQLYKRKHGGTMNATKAKEVASHFVQGHEYFQSAAGAGELVRPLILFYGAMALSRGLVLFLDTHKSKLVSGHGLKEEDWADLNTQPEKLPDFKVTVAAPGVNGAPSKAVGWLATIAASNAAASWAVGSLCMLLLSILQTSSSTRPSVPY